MKKVKPKSRHRMINYLSKHFRYFTMLSRNGSTNYARNIKLHQLPFPDRAAELKAFDFLGMEEPYQLINDALVLFAERHDYRWQIGFNGNNGGYLVLYHGERLKIDYKTRCDTCYRFTWYEEEKQCNYQRCKGRLRVLKRPIYKSTIYPGKGVDEYEDFRMWKTSMISERVDLIWDFDRTVDDCISFFIDFVAKHEIEDQPVLVEKTIKVAVPV